MSGKTKTKGTALITGGAQRIGEGLALKLAEMGYNVALHYKRSTKAAKAVAAAVKKHGVKCQIFQADLSIEWETQDLIRDAKKTFRDLNVLVNNASVFERSSLAEGDIEKLNRDFSINFKAPYILTTEFARLCKRGDIINVLDTNVIKKRTSHFSYLLSKKALHDLTELAAIELAPKIRVNGIAPGLILPPPGEKSAYLNRLSKKIPLKRKGEPANITQALEFLLTNDYLTGQTIFVDGGEHLL